MQAIPEIAQQSKHLTVFQRTANYCVPARNGKLDPNLVKSRYETFNKRNVLLVDAATDGDIEEITETGLSRRRERV